jgi:hypothetical protein
MGKYCEYKIACIANTNFEFLTAYPMVHVISSPIIGSYIEFYNLMKS